MFFKTHGQVLKKFEVEGLYSLYSIFVLRLQHKLQFFLIKLWFSTRKKQQRGLWKFRKLSWTKPVSYQDQCHIFESMWEAKYGA